MRRRKRKQKTPEQVRKRANRRQRFFHTVGRLLFVGILLSAAVLALTVFFKVDTISVEGSTKYTPEEIVAGMDVKKGDNLYLWNKVKTTNSLLEQFPYLETVQIRRHLPDALVVTVTECRAAVAVSTNGVYYLVSAQGKVLEQAATDNGLPVVAGVTLEAVRPGQMLEPAEDAYVDALLTVLQTLDAADMLTETDFINLQSLTDVRVGYLDRFDIRVGTMEQLAYRLRFAQTVIDGRLSPSDIGRLCRILRKISRIPQPDRRRMTAPLSIRTRWTQPAETMQGKPTAGRTAAPPVRRVPNDRHVALCP